MKMSRILALAAALVFTCATVSFAALDAQSFTKRVDSFNYLVDQSGSMMAKFQGTKSSKLALAKQAIKRVNDTIPALGYSAGLYAFAPYAALAPQGASVAAAGEALAGLEDGQPIFGRLTPMGPGIACDEDVIAKMPKKAAVVLVSDGVANSGVDPVIEARAILATNPDVCFHIISVADSAEGKAVLKQIASISPCSVLVEASDLVANDAAVEKFVTDVFCMPAEDEVVVLRGVNFALNSSELSSSACGILDEAAAYLKKHEANLTLLGYTDTTGSDAYNLGLSQRRAEAVKKYLVDAGVNADFLTARGMGKSLTYDNATKEGRALNRRCELNFSK